MIKGRCECGAVEYQVDGEIHDFSHCHCSQCRRLHGAAFVSFAGVWKKEFTFVSGVDEIASYASSPTHARRFCRHCGSSLMVELDSEPESLYLAMGTIDGDPNLPPGYHIYVDSGAPWHRINDDLPQYATEPNC